MSENENVSESEGSPKTRRAVLGLIGGLGAAVFIAGCASDGGASNATKSNASKSSASTSTTTAPATISTTTAATTATLASCTKVPEETAGPYPGDGSNGPNILNQTGVVRSDIRSSFGSASAVATGVPLTLNLTVYDLESGCKALSGAAVYIWHCESAGLYSM